MNDEEVAFRIVRLYFEEIARLGFKRTLDLDQMINAYFYTLKQLKGKDVALKKATEKLIKEEKEVTKKEVPSVSDASKTTTVTTKEVTTAQVPLTSEKTITQIIEEN
jgi:hypothetical protein